MFFSGIPGRFLFANAAQEGMNSLVPAVGVVIEI
jgi:hypothetical protein